MPVLRLAEDCENEALAASDAVAAAAAAGDDDDGSINAKLDLIIF